jgi:hypothetical protein
MTKFIVVAPVLLLIGPALLHYTLLSVAKNQVYHAAFKTTRSGSMQNATADSISRSYLRHLAPLYGAPAVRRKSLSRSRVPRPTCRATTASN